MAAPAPAPAPTSCAMSAPASSREHHGSVRGEGEMHLLLPADRALHEARGVGPADAQDLAGVEPDPVHGPIAQIADVPDLAGERVCGAGRGWLAAQDYLF